jgi:3-hydroxyethyl bacteriochlorophyllide a dehydrogenase
LNELAPGDVLVDVEWSGISTGTERLLWTGRMPAFPGMGYPLVPGYESVGKVVGAGTEATHRIGEQVFVPGASCFKDARGLFGGAARRLVVPGTRAISLRHDVREQGVLIALAATAQHVVATGALPELIVGHGVLGRLLARLTIAAGLPAPIVWETNAGRHGGAVGYSVIHPDADTRRDYRAIVDVSGDSTILDTLIGRLARGGEIVLAGFYEKTLSFEFAPSFLREARMRVAAEFKAEDMAAVVDLMNSGEFSLDGLITHRMDASDADQAYRIAFSDASCLKMILDWRGCA